MTRQARFWAVWLAMIMALIGASSSRVTADDAASSDSPGDTAYHAGDDARAELARIKSGPIYQRWKLRLENAENGSSLLESLQAQIESMKRDAFDWIKQYLRRLSQSSSAPATHSPSSGFSVVQALKVLAWVILGVFVLAAIILIIGVIRGVRRDEMDDAVISRARISEALVQGQALAFDGNQWLAEAERLASEKRFREVYRAMYLALLSGLHRKGRIDFRLSRTNWAYVNQFRGDDREREVFTSLTELFDNVWYGLKESNHFDVQVLQAQVESLIAGSPPSRGGHVSK